jgi:uncharacterized protein (DUF433 family)
MVVRQLGTGQVIEQVLVEYPCLGAEDIAKVLRYDACQAIELEISLPAT